MRNVKLAAIAALVLVPSIGLTQDDAAKLGQKQKAWQVANFQSFACTQAAGSSLTGTGTASFDGTADGGIDVAVAPGDGGAPTVSAHAINTKGTGGVNGRSAASSCSAVKAARGAGAATCSLSGDEQAPTVRLSVPLTALGGPDAPSSYVGTVTIVKGASSEPLVGQYLSKKGYDYYRAQSDLGATKASGEPDVLVIAHCDSAALTSKSGKPTTASYDLAVAKK
jgi:hypothetical protein